MTATVLIVEDDRAIADLVAYYLDSEGYTALAADHGGRALGMVQTSAVDLAIIDWMLPDTDGPTLSRAIRAAHTFPIILLTAKDAEIDRIHGLAAGADDYVAKPFRPLELMARVKAQLRRYKNYGGAVPALVAGQIQCADLLLDRDAHSCVQNGRKLALTRTEFAILWLLCANAGKVVSADRLFEQVWGEAYFTRDSNTVMVHVRRLREKLGETASQPRYIKTVWGVGYTIER